MWGNTQFVKLYEKTERDAVLAPVGSSSKLVDIGRPPGSRSQVQFRLRGFAFTVAGDYYWHPDPDPPALVRIGRWLDFSESVGGFKRHFTTTRHNGGFAIYFQREDDADTFLNQCLLVESVFTSVDRSMFAAPPKYRTATTQLPGENDRKLSAPFSQELIDRLYVAVSSPLDEGYTVYAPLK